MEGVLTQGISGNELVDIVASVLVLKVKVSSSTFLLFDWLLVFSFLFLVLLWLLHHFSDV